MKTLLIPTDFKLRSLNAVSRLVDKYYPEKINIVMVHLLGVTDAMGELEMLSRRSVEYRLISDEFYASCSRLKKQFPDQIENINITFFYGYTMAAFRNFLEANDVDAIVALDNYDHEALTEKSIDPAKLIYRSGIEIVATSTLAIKPKTVTKPALELEEEIA